MVSKVVVKIIKAGDKVTHFNRTNEIPTYISLLLF